MFNIDHGCINLDKYRRVCVTNEELEKYRLSYNDIFINRVNSLELIGKNAIIPRYNEPFVFESMNIRLILLKKNEIACYINNYLLIKLIREYFQNNAKIANGQVSINQDTLFNTLIPLPPLEIQERIVAKLDELMRYCDVLEEQVKQSQQTNELLLQQVLREALGA